MNERIECPFCDGEAVLKRERKELNYRKEKFEVFAHFYQCQKCREEFTTNETDTVSLLQAHNQFREKYNIPFPEEIIGIRKQYGLAASKMSEVLGLGPNGYGNYEKGEMPTPAIGNLIRFAAHATNFHELLQNKKNTFTEKVYANLKEKVREFMHEESVPKPFYTKFNLMNLPSALTGYKKPSKRKVIHLLLYYLTKCKSTYNDKLKVNKLFFYTDFLSYKTRGVSITGLSYRAIQYGPVPACYDNIFTYLENNEFITSSWMKTGDNDGAREIFETIQQPDPDAFEQEELKILDMIIERFGDMPTWNIKELSHGEKGWIELHEKKELISYQQYAFELQAV